MHLPPKLRRVLGYGKCVAFLRLAIAGLSPFILLLLASSGCSSLRQGSALRSVSTCRQLSTQGINALERGELERAESLLSQAVHTCPADVDARRHFAEALWRRGQRERAVKQLEEAQQIAGEDAALVIRCGEMYLEMGRIVEARRAAQRAVELDARSATAWVLRGKTFEAAGQDDETLACYQRALSYAPTNQAALLAMAEAHRRRGQPEQALAALQTLLETYQPGDEPQQILLLEGRALAALRRYDDAVRSFGLALQRGKPSAELLWEVAQAEAAAGRPGNAYAAARQLLALEPSHPAARALVDRLNVALAPSASRR